MYINAMFKVSKINAEYFIRTKYILAESRPVQTISIKARTSESLYKSFESTLLARAHFCCKSKFIPILYILICMRFTKQSIFFFLILFSLE